MMGFQTDRTESEMREQIDWTADRDGNPTNRWPGMSFEEGVAAALRWVLGDEDDLPIDGDPDPKDDE